MDPKLSRRRLRVQPVEEKRGPARTDHFAPVEQHPFQPNLTLHSRRKKPEVVRRLDLVPRSPDPLALSIEEVLKGRQVMAPNVPPPLPRQLRPPSTLARRSAGPGDLHGHEDSRDQDHSCKENL